MVQRRQGLRLIAVDLARTCSCTSASLAAATAAWGKEGRVRHHPGPKGPQAENVRVIGRPMARTTRRQAVLAKSNACTGKAADRCHQARVLGHGLRRSPSDSAMPVARRLGPARRSRACRELKRAGEGTRRSGALQISPVFLDQVCLKSRSDFVGRLERLIDGPFPRDVVHHAAIIPAADPPQRVRAPRIPAACPHISSRGRQDPAVWGSVSEAAQARAWPE